MLSHVKDASLFKAFNSYAIKLSTLFPKQKLKADFLIKSAAF